MRSPTDRLLVGSTHTRLLGGCQDQHWGQPRCFPVCCGPVMWLPQPSHALCQAARLRTILEQRDKLIKEGKYMPPDHHKGKEEQRP